MGHGKIGSEQFLTLCQKSFDCLRDALISL